MALLKASTPRNVLRLVASQACACKTPPVRIASGLVAAVWLSIAGCSSPPASVRCPEPASSAAQVTNGSEAESPPTRVFIVRHAEKATDGTNDPPLLPEGLVRADCLAQVLSDVKVTHVFSTDLQRTALTVQPIAAANERQVQTLPASDVESLAETLRGLPAGSVVVVAGHSNTIPLLTASLGAPLAGLDGKGNIPEQEHDRLVELVLADGSVTAPLVQLRYCEPSNRG